jgi:hypothetical protein
VITHNYTVMCDEVRREDNGKFLLLGVYADAILFNSFPAAWPGLTFFVKLHCEEPGVYGMKMRLEKLEGGAPLHQAEGAIGAQQRGPIFVPIRTPPSTFEQAGGYNFVIEFENSEPILYSFSVALAPKPFQGF